MKNKRFVIILILLFIVVATISYFVFGKIQENKQGDEITEYIPEQEIDEKRIKANSGIFIL